uniref:protein-tyrosine-phosphatase n=2 Tax=Callithrix jacchus TaxID=9483 RepID=A0A5F4W8N5_CALJA
MSLEGAVRCSTLFWRTFPRAERPPRGFSWGTLLGILALGGPGLPPSGRPRPAGSSHCAFPLSIVPVARRVRSRAPMEGLGRSCLWLRRELSPPRPQLLLLDCRSRELYESARIGGALSVALPALLLRRLRRGSLSVRALLPGPPLQPPPPAPVLLYDQSGGRRRCGEAEAETEEWEAESVLGTLLQKLREEGYLAYYLQGGFSRFQAECPHLCETSLSGRASSSLAPLPSPAPVVGLGSLCLGSDCSDVESEADRDSMSCGLDSEGVTPPPVGLRASFPVQILPNLYLGSARDSANLESLAKLGIRYILNVTPNLPNFFEKNGDFHYKQIPISDHWSQNLSQFFPEAIAFIGESTPPAFPPLHLSTPHLSTSHLSASHLSPQPLRPPPLHLSAPSPLHLSVPHLPTSPSPHLSARHLSTSLSPHLSTSPSPISLPPSSPPLRPPTSLHRPPTSPHPNLSAPSTCPPPHQLLASPL